MEEIDVRRFLKPFTRPVYLWRRWRARRSYALYERHRPEPHGELPCIIQRLWVKTAEIDDDADCGSLPPRVDEEFVRKLLLKLGEFERSRNLTLIREMVGAARSESGCLDEEAVANAISSDLGDWEVGCEDKSTTLFEDVFGTRDQLDVTKLAAGDPCSTEFADAEVGNANPAAELANSRGDNCCQEMSLCWSYLCWISTVFSCFGYCWLKQDALFDVEPSNIDMVIDAHHSVVIVVLIWIFLVLT